MICRQCRLRRYELQNKIYNFCVDGPINNEQAASVGDD
jgi:hypothetical protein